MPPYHVSVKPRKNAPKVTPKLLAGAARFKEREEERKALPLSPLVEELILHRAENGDDAIWNSTMRLGVVPDRELEALLGTAGGSPPEEELFDPEVTPVRPVLRQWTSEWTEDAVDPLEFLPALVEWLRDNPDEPVVRGFPPSTEDKMPRGLCPKCNLNYALTESGSLRKHLCGRGILPVAS